MPLCVFNKKLIFTIFFLLFFIKCNFADSSLNINTLPWVANGHDGDELSLVKPFLPVNPVVLEAGACGGEDTVNFPKVWPRCTVHAFEPVPSFFANLKKHAGKLPNVHLYPFGLFTKTGTYPFYLCPAKAPGGASSLFPTLGITACGFDDRPSTIFCKNLDEWACENHVDHIDYMWLDMEGAELYVLSSAPIILKTVRVISCELNFRKFREGTTQFEDLYNFLTKQGFVLYKLWGSPTWQAVGIFIRSEFINERKN